jgi:hypothetical protein
MLQNFEFLAINYCPVTMHKMENNYGFLRGFQVTTFFLVHDDTKVTHASVVYVVLENLIACLLYKVFV